MIYQKHRQKNVSLFEFIPSFLMNRLCSGNELYMKTKFKHNAINLNKEPH